MAHPPTFVGPHEGRELELMRSGVKPLSMFVEFTDSDFSAFPEAEFDALALQMKLAKHIAYENKNIKRTLYALPGEEWRINAMLLVLGLYSTLTPGWRPDLERAIGLLLGYERDEIEKFLTWKDARGE